MSRRRPLRVALSAALAALAFNTPAASADPGGDADDCPRLIAYSSSPTPGVPLNLRLVPESGGTPTEPVTSRFAQLDPAWSPDGRSLAFTSRNTSSTGRRGLYVLSVADRTDAARPARRPALRDVVR